MEPKTRVIVWVDGGLVVGVDKPDCIEVVIRDLDIYGAEDSGRVERDEDGNEYVEDIW